MNAKVLAIIILFVLLALIGYIIFTKNENGRKKANNVVSVISVIVILIPTIFPEKTAEYIDPNVEQCKTENTELKRLNEELEEENLELSEKNEELEKENASLKVQTTSIEGENAQGIPFEKVLDVLYDGSGYKRYDGDNKFSVGGKEYRYGFTIGCDRGLVGLGPGYALFNLDGNYSKMVCEVGRVDGFKGDATAIITSKSGINESYPLSGEIASQSLEIDLKNTKDLKITLDANSTLSYGFFNIYFYE